MYKCIDLSEYQNHGSDFVAIKNAGVDASVIRLGEIYQGRITEDSCYQENIDGAISAGLHAGPYFYTCASSIQMAYDEANFMVEKLKGKKITMPCYVDLEEKDPWLMDNANDVIQVYYNVLTNAGYLAGCYSYYYWFKNLIDLERWKDIPLWIAQNPVMTLDPKYFGMWQFGTTNVNGVAKNPVDTNELYVPYWDQIQAKEVPPVVEPPIQIQPEGVNEMKPQLDCIYSAHSKNLGWGPDYTNGQTAGTVHQDLRLEAIKVKIQTALAGFHIMCRAHVQNIGWMDPVYDGTICGTVGEGLELEALQLQLSGPDIDGYSIWYQVQVKNIGWLNWVRDGALTGTVGRALQAEAIRVMVLDSSIALTVDSAEVYMEQIPPIPITPEPAPQAPQEPNNGIQAEMISDHFAKSEFACDCGGRYCDGWPVQMNQDVVNGIEGIRLSLDVPVHVSSGVRCPQRNAEVGGVPNSKHMLGLAADIWIDGMNRSQVDLIADTAENLGMRTIRYYDQLFVHCEL